MNKRGWLLLSTMLVSGCSLAPDFVMPGMPVPDQYREPAVAPDAQDAVGLWKPVVGTPVENGAWWSVFEDTQLNDLEAQAIYANPSLQAAAMRFEESRAVAQANTDHVLPTLSAGANAVRSKPSNASVAAFGNNNAALKPYNLFEVQGTASYEVDLLGRVHDTYKAYAYDADAQEALYQQVLLALQADVAQHYFALRALDSERQLLREFFKVREEAAHIMQRRFDEGEVADIDNARAQSELASAQAELTGVERARAVREHALATLLGKTPADFTFAESPLTSNPPAIPPGLPSTLLERRPDVAAAVASMQAANQRIGVARTAFFPILNLTATGGLASTELSDVFKWSGHSWALGQAAGTALTLPIFDNGKNFARLDAAKFSYEEAVANYRQQALTAFREVEDNLSEQRLLSEQFVQQSRAAELSNHAANLIQLRYDHGDVDYFEVVDAQRTALSAERAALQARGQRFAAAVSLIRALGGGWDSGTPAPAADPSQPAAPAPAPVEKPEAPAATAAPQTPPADLPLPLPAPGGQSETTPNTPSGGDPMLSITPLTHFP